MKKLILLLLILPLITYAQDDCIFDQKTQTDKFLKDNASFNSYTWDQKTKTATIPLEGGDTLLVYRGGCMHFSVIATFISHNSTIDYNDWEEVYKIAYWIASELDEYNLERLKKGIDEKAYYLEDYSHNVKDEVLEFKAPISGYSLERILGQNVTTIILKSSSL